MNRRIHELEMQKAALEKSKRITGQGHIAVEKLGSKDWPGTVLHELATLQAARRTHLQRPRRASKHSPSVGTDDFLRLAASHRVGGGEELPSGYNNDDSSTITWKHAQPGYYKVEVHIADIQRDHGLGHRSVPIEVELAGPAGEAWRFDTTWVPGLSTKILAFEFQLLPATPPERLLLSPTNGSTMPDPPADNFTSLPSGPSLSTDSTVQVVGLVHELEPLHSAMTVELPLAATVFRLQSSWAVADTEILTKANLGRVWTTEMSMLQYDAHERHVMGGDLTALHSRTEWLDPTERARTTAYHSLHVPPQQPVTRW
jgi:hypothetical protein